MTDNHPFRASDHRVSTALTSIASLFINNTVEILVLLLLRWKITFI